MSLKTFQAPEQGTQGQGAQGQGAQGQGGPPSPQNPEDVAQNNGDNMGLNNGRPPGTPPPQNQGDGQNGQNPMGNAGADGGDGQLPPLDGTPTPEAAAEFIPEASAEVLPADGAMVQGGNENNGAMTPGGTPSNDGPQNGTGTPPDIPAGAMPTFNTPPSFGTLIGEGDAITITLNVTGSEKYNMEFVISQEVDGRQSPRVIHMEQSVSASTSVRAPASYDYPVWLIITADVNGDGPSDDDLIGGTTEPMTLGSDDITLDVTLQADDEWMSQVPWYTKGLEDGQPITP